MTYDPEAICPQCGIKGAHFPSTCLSIRFDRLKEETRVAVDESNARAARAEAIIERFSTWIDRVCGPIHLSDTVKKVDLIEGWDRARTPEFFAVMDAERTRK